MREKIIDILEEIKPGVDYDTETDLIEHKILESLEILQLVTELSEEYDIDIPLSYIKPENFKTVDTILSMVVVVLEGE